VGAVQGALSAAISPEAVQTCVPFGAPVVTAPVAVVASRSVRGARDRRFGAPLDGLRIELGSASAVVDILLPARV